MSKYTILNCIHCQSEFQALTKEFKRSGTKYCSLKCSSDHRKGTKQIKEHNCTCSTCSKTFYRSSSKQKISKSGYMFCSRTCKEKAQSFNNPDHIKAIMPSHYHGNSFISHRKVFKSTIKELKCEECGYDKHPEILQVHHKDRNRKNNSLDNFQLLCPNCHSEEHFLKRDGFFTHIK